MTTLAKLLVKLDVDEKGVDRGIARTRASFRKMQKHADEDGNKVGTRFATALTTSLRKTLTPSVTAIATGLSAQITGAMAAGLVSGVTKMVHGVGAAMALLPSVALAAGVAVGTVGLALRGMGDALKAGLEGDAEKFAEAMGKLAPAARSVVRELVAARGAFDAMQRTVQQRFFAPLVGEISELAKLYLPMLSSMLGAVASALGRAAAGVTGLLRSPAVFAGMTSAIGQAGQAVANMAAGIPNLVRAFLPLVRVGASFLPALTGGFEAATGRLARFMEQAERTGRLREFIQGGLDALRSLWETTKQVGRILGNLGEIGRIVFDRIGLPAGTLLDTIETLTEKAAAFFKTAKGQNVLAKVFEFGSGFAENFFGSLQKVAEMLAPVLPQIAEFIAAIVKFKFALLSAFAPVVKIIGERVLPLLTSVLNWVSSSGPAMSAILAVLGAKWAYSGIQATIAAAKTVAAFASMLASAATTTASVVAQIAVQIAKWALLGVQSLIHAAKVAAAWLISMGPIALIVAAVIGLVVVIVKNWDTIKRVITGAASAVLDFLKKNWPYILAILMGPIGAIVIGVIKHWDTIWRVTTGVFSSIVGFIGKVPGWIWSAIKGIGSVVASVFRSALDGAVSLVRWGVDTIIWLFRNLPWMAWNALQGLGDVIWGAVKSAVNGAIGLINYIIDLWNDFSIGMSWGGFNPPGPGSIPGFSFEVRTPNIPKIPTLAKGGIATDATLGIFGEAGPEAIIPLDRLEDIMAPIPAPAGGGITVTFDFAGADSEIGRALKKMVRVKGRGDVRTAFT